MLIVMLLLNLPLIKKPVNILNGNLLCEKNYKHLKPRLHIDGYGYGCGFGYGDRKRQDFEILGKGTRTHTGYVSYRVRVRIRVRDLEEVPMLHSLLLPYYRLFLSIPLCLALTCIEMGVYPNDDVLV